MAWRANPSNASRVLTQRAVPTILLPAGNWTSNSGQMAVGTPLPYLPLGVVMVYLFASGIGAAGLYQATFTGTAAAPVMQIVGNPATVVGAYTPALTQVVLGVISVPGGAMGPNGSIRWDIYYSYPSGASVKSLVMTFGGLYIFGLSGTATASARAFGSLRNRGVLNSQLISGTTLSNGPGNTGTTPSQSAVDTSVDVPVRIAAQLASASDFIILDAYTIEILPS